MHVTKNVGMIERVARGSLGFALITLGLQEGRRGWSRALLVASGIDLMITSSTGHCTANTLLRRNSFPDPLDQALERILAPSVAPEPTAAPAHRGPSVPPEHVALPAERPEAPEPSRGFHTGDF